MKYPISETYPAVYRDARGEERTTLHNDGQELRITVRGVTFVGTSLDNFRPLEETSSESLAIFRLNCRAGFVDICDYELQYAFPVPILVDNLPRSAHLTVEFSIGLPNERGVFEKQYLCLTLEVGEEVYTSRGKTGYFEWELLDLQKSLPSNVQLRTCFGCACSDYSPYGHWMFGYMMCFRDDKDAYLKVETKDDFFDIWDTLTERVQETYHCPEWELRKPGTGYRG